jgi:hypothetical protein
VRRPVHALTVGERGLAVIESLLLLLVPSST